MRHAGRCGHADARPQSAVYPPVSAMLFLPNAAFRFILIQYPKSNTSERKRENWIKSLILRRFSAPKLCGSVPGFQQNSSCTLEKKAQIRAPRAVRGGQCLKNRVEATRIWHCRESYPAFIRQQRRGSPVGGQFLRAQQAVLPVRTSAIAPPRGPADPWAGGHKACPVPAPGRGGLHKSSQRSHKLRILLNPLPDAGFVLR